MPDEITPRPRPIPTALIYVCFLGSGLTSLVYELLWVRRLSLIFGSTTYSVTTVLAAFMAGLGVGGYLIGRRVDRGGRGLRTYAYLELAVALFALCSLPMLRGVEWTYAAVQGALGLGQGGATLLKFILAFPVLAFPAALMGGTLPALTLAIVRRREVLHQRVGLLYGINTVGAAVGTVLAGVVLIQHLGLWRSVLLCSSINLVIGLAALWTARRREPAPEEPPEASPAAAEVQLRRHLRKPAVAYSLLAVVLTGTLSMSYEVIWTRLLTLTMGSSAYAFTIILGIFLLGISAGSLAFSLLSRGRRPSAHALALVLTALAAWVTVSVLLLPSLPSIWLHAAPLVAHSMDRVLVGQVVLSLAMLGVPTMLFGAALPLAMGVVARELGQVGRDVGGIYLCNTVGAILGSLLTGFLLIPVLGTQVSLLIGLVLNLLLAGAGLVLFSEHKIRRLAGAAALLLLGVVALLQPAWGAEVLDSGVGHRMANNVPRSAWHRLQMLSWGGGRLAYFKEGLNATVSVRQFDHGTALLVNGKADASTNQDMTCQVMLGQIPMLVHPKPEAVAVVGWGSGVTAYTTTFFPEVQRVDVMEIESAVVGASRFFHRVNGAAERHKKVHIHFDDARSYLLATRRRFDVLISEPSNPWMAGVANLFSRDFYELARKRLAPGGIFGQWLQLYRMDSRSVAMVFRTMLESFPHVQVWFTDRDNLILLGSDKPLRPSLARVRKAYKADPRVPRYMAAFGSGMLPEQFFGAFLLGQEDLKRMVDGFDPEVMTDDRPVLEYQAMAGLYHRNHPHWDSLWRLKLDKGAILPPMEGPTPPVSAVINGAARVMGFHTMASGRISAWGMKHYPDKPFVWLTRARFHEAHGNQAEARKLLDKMPDSAGWAARVALRRCRSMVKTRQYTEALDALQAMTDFRPGARRLCKLDALIGAKKFELAWAEVEALLGDLDRDDDADLLKVNRRAVYGALDRLIQSSRQYSRGITAATLRKEPDGGEVSRLDALVDAQIAAKVPTEQILRTLDQLGRFGLTNVRHIKLAERHYRQAGRLVRADALARIIGEVQLEPEGKPLWPKPGKEGAK